MKTFTLILITNFSALSFSLMAQSTVDTVRVNLKLADSYVLRIRADSKLYEGKCDCLFRKQSKKCSLYRITIQSVIYSGDTSVYDNLSLKNVNYMVVKNNQTIDLGRDFTATFTNSKSTDYLVFSRPFELNDASIYAFYYDYAHLIGLYNCPKKKDHFQKAIRLDRP